LRFGGPQLPRVKFIMGVEDLYVVSGIIRRFFSRRRYSGIHGSKCQNATFPSARNTAIIATSRSILLYIGAGAGLARRSIEVGDASAAAHALDPDGLDAPDIRRDVVFRDHHLRGERLLVAVTPVLSAGFAPKRVAVLCCCSGTSITLGFRKIFGR